MSRELPDMTNLGVAVRSSRSLRTLRRRVVRTGTVGPASVLIVMSIVYFAERPSVLNSDGIQTIFNAATALALAAAGASIVTIVGGFDFSVGAAISVVNVVIATRIGEASASHILVVLAALLIGLGIGLVNGVLVARLRIASIVATLATSFFWGGVALLILAQPGGSIPEGFSTWFTDTIGPVPNSLLIIMFVLLMWLLFKRSRSGRAMYAVGGDQGAARLTGVPVARIVVLAYSIAGLLYGLSATFLTAFTASGDPNVGTQLLLPVFTAIAIGGVRFGGGKGDIFGAVVGAFILYMISDLLFAFGVNSFYTPILNGVVLVVAVAISTNGARWTRRANRTATGPSTSLGRAAT